MNIQLIIGMMAEALSGSNARIMVQVENKCYEKTVGNAAALSKAPIYYHMNTGIKRRLSFLQWMRESISTANIKQRTRWNHENTYKHLVRFCTDVTFDDLDRKFVRDFDEHLTRIGAKVNTIGKHMSVLHTYVAKALDEELITKDPFATYHRRSERTHKEFLTEHEVFLLLHIVNTLTRPYERIAVRGFLFSCFTGLRYSDVLRVTRRTIRVEDNITWLALRIQKTDRELRIPISEVFGGAGMLLIDNTKGYDEQQFPLPANDVTNKNIQRVLRRYGITKHISFHCGRVTAATILLDKNVPLTTIQHILGHSSVKTTEIYAKMNDATMLRSLR